LITLALIVISFTAIVIAIFTYLWAYRKINLQEVEIINIKKVIRDLSILNEMVSEMNTILDKKEFFSTTLAKVKTLLKAEKAAVIILENGTGVIKDFYTTMGDTTDCKRYIKGVLKRVINEQVTIRTQELQKVEGYEGLPQTHPKIRDILIVPVILRGKTIGALMVTDKSAEESFTVEDEDLLLNASFHMALALEKLWFYDKLQHMANLDGLTELYNHRAFQDRLDEEIERARRGNRTLALLMLDIDLFKIFNDTYGHLAGDEILKEVSKIIRASIRKMDVPARYGGEEFAVILPEVTLEGAILVAERIREEVEHKRINFEGRHIGVTISIGIAIYPEDGKDKKSLIASADLALYHAKRTGRNRVCTYKEFITECNT